MGRASGRRQPRTPHLDADTAEGRDIGLSDRQAGIPSPIPGGATHLVQSPTMRQAVDAPAPRPEFRGVMAHGVPPERHTAHERGTVMRGPNAAKDPQPVYTHPATHPVAPVPVTIVETGRDVRPLRSTAHHRYLLQAAGQQAVRVVGRNAMRKHVLVLNEDALHNIRLGQTIAELVGANQGSVLPATTSSYLKIETQDELYAISDDSGTPYIDIIEVFDRPQAEVQ